MAEPGLQLISPPRSGRRTMAEPETLRWLRRAPAGIAAAGGRLGVLSGTFNPPTRAHLALATQALEQAGLDEVLFVLPEIPPHKRDLEARLEDRAAMVARLAALDPRFSAAVTRGGLFLEIHSQVAPHYPPRTRLYFLVGRDAAQRILLDWPYPDPAGALAEMFARFDFLVADRAGEFRLPATSPLEPYHDRIHPLAMPPDWKQVSATEVRARLARSEPVEQLVSPEVLELIRQRRLYGGGEGEAGHNEEGP
jgi:nicotinate (nicotinamide) nucleotide adenylyltransferase